MNRCFVQDMMVVNKDGLPSAFLCGFPYNDKPCSAPQPIGFCFYPLMKVGLIVICQKTRRIAFGVPMWVSLQRQTVFCYAAHRFLFLSPHESELSTGIKTKTGSFKPGFTLWGLTDSNRRPSACKADALNQLS